MSGLRALASPASLKGVLAARDAAAALEDGFAHVGVACVQQPLADGGDGTIDALCDDWRSLPAHDAFGSFRTARVGVRDDAVVVEAAEVLPLDPLRLDPLRATSRGLGELIAALDGSKPLVIGLGGTATMDGGAGLLDVLDALPAATTVLCDVATTLYDAPRLFGPQKGADAAQVRELERRLRARPELAPYADVPGSGAAGGLGAALASLGAELVPGAPAVLDLIGFDPTPFKLVVTGEGRVDATTVEGKAPAEVVERCAVAGVPCVVFGGVVERLLPGAETIALSGDPARASRDLFELGLRLGTRLLDAAG
ncbi:MAG TPA: glycerate kinase [Gaiellaceae bacterium]|jgi:glycerate kinase|nr:glycerate kinase [Gaiellaceae bacterium]